MLSPRPDTRPSHPPTAVYPESRSTLVCQCTGYFSRGGPLSRCGSVALQYKILIERMDCGHAPSDRPEHAFNSRTSSSLCSNERDEPLDLQYSFYYIPRTPASAKSTPTARLDSTVECVTEVLRCWLPPTVSPTAYLANLLAGSGFPVSDFYTAFSGWTRDSSATGLRGLLVSQTRPSPILPAFRACCPLPSTPVK